jgi:hypothetical protein
MNLLPLMTALLVPVLGCGDKGPSVDEAHKTTEAKVGAKLTAIDTIGKQPAARAAAASWPKLTFVETHPETTGNTVLAYGAQLGAIANGRPLGPGMGLDWDLFNASVSDCWYAIRKREFPEHEAGGTFKTSPIKAFQIPLLCREVEQATYLAVVTPAGAAAAAAPAVSDIPADEADTPTTFTGAKTGGTIDLYELPSGKSLGRKLYDAASSGTVQYKTDSSGVGASIDADLAVGKDLTNQTKLAIRRVVTGS